MFPPCRIKLLWQNMLFLTDPQFLDAVAGRGEKALDKAVNAYSAVNYVSDYSSLQS